MHDIVECDLPAMRLFSLQPLPNHITRRISTGLQSLPSVPP